VRNSWGEYWGEEGWMKLARGIDELGIEDKCFYVIPEGWGSKGHIFTKNDEDKVYDFAAQKVLAAVAKDYGFPFGLFSAQDGVSLPAAEQPKEAAASPGGVSALFATALGLAGLAAGVAIGKRGQRDGYVAVADANIDLRA
jgi:hypothetical protein